jgi:Spy/CpxP family protein refolding chaperone
MKAKKYIQLTPYVAALLALATVPTGVSAQQHGGAARADTTQSSKPCSMGSMSGGMMGGGMKGGGMMGGGMMGGGMMGDSMGGSGMMMGMPGMKISMHAMRLQPKRILKHKDDLELSDEQVDQLEAAADAWERVLAEHREAAAAKSKELEDLFQAEQPDPEQVRATAQAVAQHHAAIHSQMLANAAAVKGILSAEQRDKARTRMGEMRCMGDMHRSPEQDRERSSPRQGR